MKRKDFLVFGKPFIGEEEIKEVVATLRSGWWGTGPKTELFEKEFGDYVGSEHAISVNSATAGLHMALKGLGIGPGDEVITTPLTFVSTANVVIHCGATPVFADVNRETWNIDPVEVEKKITKKTKVILPVHLHGRPVEMDKITKLAKKYKLKVVEDAAHAAEAFYKGKKIGTIGDATVFSFYVTKNIACGEGGMITTDSKKLDRVMRVMRLHGLSRDAWKRYSVKHFSLYEAVMPGYKYNLTDIASSIGLHQLRRVEKNLKRRQEIWQMYNKAFANESFLTLPAPIDKDVRHAMHLYAILVDIKKLKVKRNVFVDKLIKENIGSGVHFFPIHLQPYYRKTYGYHRGDFPNAEYVGDRILSLPMGANLTDADVADVINAVKKVLHAL
ncbi:UDP-4-amino-4,6-dideoxy-N-acetyl-beta-L-altrosamine transaminase [Candidatus Woesebacteria bacterium RIFOXYA1_FULL_43_9]|uniref:UDP-4-amino-4, 6-dideoxy-N-acetyl-beta-L-altrosamine transaminase n=1 Tax=Candidatus Woesebacteria bacterium RIFOXYA1_FULL_43_9 TaxID=1802534 RepID=A0A1F8CN03_9BACT|nr:MAG: UDP-4-amino-4,6-dideoxy-N-acetyl-beta-L-altrosamine transaminase [Candidatus Woesebacteria bacterium RIFOXYA1_FULL_43_9]